MKRFLFASFFALCFFGVSQNASAGLITLDFNELGHQEYLSNQYAHLGVLFSLDTAEGPDSPYAWNLAGNQNFKDPITGEVLSPGIVITPSGQKQPRDPFYDMIIDFTTPINFFSIQVLDADELFTVYALSNNNQANPVHVFQAGYPPYGPHNNFAVINVELGSMTGTQWFDQIVIDVTRGPGLTGYDGGPEFYDNMSYNQIPEPASLILLGSALLGLGAKRSRRTAA